VFPPASKRGSQRDLAIKIEVVGQKDFTHASVAKLFTNPIMAQRFADHEKALHVDSRCNSMKSYYEAGPIETTSDITEQ
jgi:hypothetical protein